MTTLNKIRNLILDMDGVLWRGDTPMPGLEAFFETLAELKISFVLATNNASKSPESYEEKFAGFGVTVKSYQVLTSAEVTATYLSQLYPPKSNAFVVGGQGIAVALTRHGFNVLSIDEVIVGSTASCVVVGFGRDITYDAFAAGTILINKGAQFVGTNPDVTFPSEWGNLPGAGSFIALIQTATGVEPIIIGKPGPIIFQDALSRLGGTGENTAMVGDRLSTDIAGGQAAGMKTILLLSGISSRDDLAQANGLQPDFVFEDISDLARNLRMGNGR
ncbi:MAG: HAD-IIA family hydrolase [Chloroflexi bacterium]|nr:HAD-IIA family hydrolase [Chloroflexota bacterium]